MLGDPARKCSRRVACVDSPSPCFYNNKPVYMKDQAEALIMYDLQFACESKRGVSGKRKDLKFEEVGPGIRLVYFECFGRFKVGFHR